MFAATANEHTPNIHAIAIIPVYNHARYIGKTVAAIRQHGLSCLLINDGSDAACTEVLKVLASNDKAVQLLSHPRNLGKGAAVMTGLKKAAAQGYSHALQIDADGQHNSADIPIMLALAKQTPDAVINGWPQYDASVPKARLYGRYLTHIWVWINTLSLAIKDSMCGFRIYPLAATSTLLNSQRIGQRMDFDTEILVHLNWRDVPTINVPTQVIYPADGISHFDTVADNILISKMHTRLFFGMLWRLPTLLRRLLTRQIASKPMNRPPQA